MNRRNKKLKERQYAVEAEIRLVMVATSLKEAKEMAEEQLNGMNNIYVKIGGGQALVPQVQVPEDDTDG